MLDEPGLHLCFFIHSYYPNTMIKCIKCQHDLKCTLSILTEEEDRPIEISYQWWVCENCGVKYYGILEDSHVNIFDDKLLHKGYLVEEHKWQESLEEALKCPDPRNSNCKCEFHRDAPPAGFYGDSAWYTND